MIRAITLDLDDTLWPVAPAILRAEQALFAFLAKRCPATAERFPPLELRALRDRVAAENPHLSHDFSAQRKLSLAIALTASGDDVLHVEAAFDVFYRTRNQVELYPDAAAALPRLASDFPLAALTNGNADLALIGLDDLFVFQLGAREHGRAKPCPSIFLAACQRLGYPPHEVLHVGDDPELDISGAQRAGMPSCWINRLRQSWPVHLPEPTFVAQDLLELCVQLSNLGLHTAIDPFDQRRST